MLRAFRFMVLLPNRLPPGYLPCLDLSVVLRTSWCKLMSVQFRLQPMMLAKPLHDDSALNPNIL